jgi:hypothetical protein
MSVAPHLGGGQGCSGRRRRLGRGEGRSRRARGGWSFSLVTVYDNGWVLHFLDLLAWGDVPTAVGAAVSLGALIAAIVAAKSARKILDVELRRDDERDKAEQRQQAEKIAAWPTLAPANPQLSRGSTIKWGIAVRNASELPVYQVGLIHESIPAGGGRHTVVQELVPPGDWVLIGRTLYARADVPRTSLNEKVPDRDFVLSIAFTDAAGQRWTRDRDGRLAPVVDGVDRAVTTVVAARSPGPRRSLARRLAQRRWR